MHMSNLLRGALFVGLSICVAAKANQDGVSDSPGIDVVTSAELFKKSGAGDGEFVPAEYLRVGDEIFYTLRVRNGGDKLIASPSIIKAIPRNTRYVDGSAVGPAAQISFSIDGGATFATAERLTIATPAGERRAESGDFTHIRWQLRYALAPGATALLRFRGVFQ
jgi:uncharacterized repeat protein (TIGR01451 family)